MFVDKIFKRATIRGVADYLLFGPDAYEDNQNYEERLEEVYRKFEKAVQKYDQNATPELLDMLKNVNTDKENT